MHIIESPYSNGNNSTPEQIQINKDYIDRRVRTRILQGHPVYASHCFLTRGLLDDTKPTERAEGIKQGWLIAQSCKQVFIYFAAPTHVGSESIFTEGMFVSLVAYIKMGLRSSIRLEEPFNNGKGKFIIHIAELCANAYYTRASIPNYAALKSHASRYYKLISDTNAEILLCQKR